MSSVEEDSTVEIPSKRKCAYVPRDDIRRSYIPSDLNLVSQYYIQSFVENNESNYYDNNGGIDDELNNEIVNSDSDDFKNNKSNNLENEIIEQVEFETENNEFLDKH